MKVWETQIIHIKTHINKYVYTQEIIYNNKKIENNKNK